MAGPRAHRAALRITLSSVPLTPEQTEGAQPARRALDRARDSFGVSDADWEMLARDRETWSRGSVALRADIEVVSQVPVPASARARIASAFRLHIDDDLPDERAGHGIDLRGLVNVEQLSSALLPGREDLFKAAVPHISPHVDTRSHLRMESGLVPPLAAVSLLVFLGAIAPGTCMSSARPRATRRR